MSQEKASLPGSPFGGSDEFRAVIEQSPISTVIYDAEGRPLEVNQAFRNLWGIELSDAPPDYRLLEDPQLIDQGIVEQLKRVFAGETVHLPPMRYDMAATTNKGKAMWTEATAFPILDSDGKVSRIVLIQQDVTRQIEAEQSLRTSERLLQLVIEAIPTPVAYVDSSCIYRYANAALYHMMGIKVDGLTQQAALGETAFEMLRPYRERALAGQVATFEQVVPFRYGGDRYVQCSYIPDFDDTGKVRGFVVSYNDLTERVRSEEALRRAEKLATAGRMAATIAHEVNNPLEAVTNLLFLVRTSGETDDMNRAFLQQADDELRRVAHIVRQTLGFYRETASARIADIATAAGDIVSLYQKRAESRHVHLTLNTESGCKALVVEGEIKQVVTNLLTNALDATPSGGSVAVSVRRDGNMVELSIRDTGSGIEKKNLEHLFEPFFTTKKDVGTGLGLWVSKGIVEAYGGKIEFTSPIVDDHGTEFRVALPCVDAGAAVGQK
jgi:PAS domain S-box-containing protein